MRGEPGEATANESHWSGPAFCPTCDYDWVAIVLATADINALTCPKCKGTEGRLL
jgi:hypothetical protein